jgi:hemolysin D
MSSGSIVNLIDCSEFRQTIAARPPRVIHGTVILLLGLLGVVLVWAALVKANLVVRATGRVRPVEIPTRVYAPAGTDIAGRVVEAPFDEGDLVQAGDVLVRLDTEQIDNRLAKLTRTVAAAEAEVAMLAGLESLFAEQLAAAQEKALAEVKQAEAAMLRASDQRSSTIRSAQASEHAARDQYQRNQRLKASGVVTAEEIVKAETALREAEEKLVAAELPIDQGPVQVARQTLKLVERDFAVRIAEAKVRRAAKESEADAARRDVRQLELQRAESVLRSPIDGVVVGGQIDTGDVLEPGKSVLEIAPNQGYRFEAAIASEDLGQIQVGMPVRIKFDAYDYQRYGVMCGTVIYISPDSHVPRSNEGGTAAKSPAQRNSQPVFVVRIEMQADAVGSGELQGAVKLGLGGTAEIVTDRESLLKIFFRKIRQTISLG